jgi:hypothetical protein
MRLRQRSLYSVLLVLLLAASARIINSSTWPVWTDEGASIYTASDPHISSIMDKLTENHHPPLYFVLLGAWEQVAGDSRIALRMLTIFSGMIAVAVVYRMGKDWFGHTAAWYGTLLFAVSDLVVQYAQQVRHYGWLTLAVALMSLLFLRALRRPTAGRFAVYAVSIAFMLYIHYLGLMVLALQAVVGLVGWRAPLRDKAGLVGAWALALVLYTPWLIAFRQILLLFNEGGLASRPNIEPTTPERLVIMLNVLTNHQTALVIGLFALAVWMLARTRDTSVRWLARVYLALWGGGLFVGMAAMNPWLHVLTPRTLVFLTPGLVLTVGYGFALLQPPLRRLLIASMVVVTLATTDIIQPRLASDAAAQTLAANYSPNDLIVLETGADDNAFNYELHQALQDPESDIIRTLPWVGTRGGVTPVIPEIQNQLNRHDRVWVVQWFQLSQVIPFLAGGGDGFVRAIETEVPVGAQYRDLFGDNEITVALYERVSGESRTFGDLISLHTALVSEMGRAGAPLFVDLWWSALKPVPLDYSVGVYLLDENGVVRAEHNGPPGTLPTSQWTPDTLVFDRHTLMLAPDLPSGTYYVGVRAYWYGDLVGLPVDGSDIAMIGDVQVQ